MCLSYLSMTYRSSSLLGSQEQSALVRLLLEAGELDPGTRRLRDPELSERLCVLPQRSLQTNRLREADSSWPTPYVRHL